jgi:hypothetical protein
MIQTIVLALILSYPSAEGHDLLDLAVQPHMYHTMDSCIAAGKAAKEKEGSNVKGWVCMYTTEKGTPT